MEEILEIKDLLMNEEFDSLENSQKRVDYVFEKIGSIDNIRENVKEFLSDYKKDNSKSSERSQSYREKGNYYFSHKNMEYALYYYTLAVMSAPYPSKSDLESNNELTYAFTARSLTFFEIEAFDNALFDINCALSLSDITMKFKERIQLMSHKVSCLCRLRRYSKALSVISATIQLVPCLSINNQIVSSLIEAKDQILERMESQTQESDENQTENRFESIEEHLKNIEAFRSTTMELFEAEGKGRHYKAIESIPKGTIVSVEKSISCMLFRDFFSTHCQNCLKNVGYKWWPCRKCSQVVFCDQKCADNAYHHSYECGIIDIIHKLGLNHHILFRTVVLVGPQMAIELAKETTKQLEVFHDSDPNKVNFIKFFQLIDHKDMYCLKTKIPSILRSIQLALILESFEEFKAKDRLTETYVKELSALLDELNYKTFVNIFGVYEEKNKYQGFRGCHIGNALMFDSSFFNHSCSPNTQWIFNGQHITVVTTEDIAANNEVSISYGPYSQTMSFTDRQNFLQKRYFFQCKCKACMTDARALPTLKCYYCEDGFFVYDSDATDTESSCMICGQTLETSLVIKRIKETENSFNRCIAEFERDTSAEEPLLRAEELYSQFCEYIYPKSDRMNELNSILSRSFDAFGDYSKAMIYSKNILESLIDTNSFQYCIEMVFFSQVFYHYLYRQRKTFKIDDEWSKCFKTISETLVVLKNCKKKLVETVDNKSLEDSASEVVAKTIEVIDNWLKSKEQQICIISKLTDDSNPEDTQPMV